MHYHVEASRGKIFELHVLAKLSALIFASDFLPFVRLQTVIYIASCWFVQNTLIAWIVRTTVYVFVLSHPFTIVCPVCGIWYGVVLRGGDRRRFSVLVAGMPGAL